MSLSDDEAFSSVQLAQQIAKVIKQKVFSQTDADELMGLPESQVRHFYTVQMVSQFSSGSVPLNAEWYVWRTLQDFY